MRAGSLQWQVLRLPQWDGRLFKLLFGLILRVSNICGLFTRNLCFPLTPIWRP